jgi:ribosome-associated protein
VSPAALSTEPVITLVQFVKLCRAAGSGGQAKVRVRNGDVQVNGALETRPGRKLHNGDRVTVDGETHTVALQVGGEAGGGGG